MRLTMPLLLVVALLCGASEASARGGRGPQRGVASWYGYEWKRTANGERYDPSSMTAAHRTLPFGTLVRVTHRASGRSAVVRINNRGPFKKGRVIDLSKAAARELQMIDSGIVPVEIAVISPGRE